MKIKHLLLPLVAGMASYAMTAKAQNAKPAQQMGGKSMTFIENKGQVTDQFHSPRTDIDFKLSGGKGLNIFFGKGTIHYQWAKRESGTEEISPLHSAALHSGRDDDYATSSVISSEAQRNREIPSTMQSDDDGFSFGNRGTAEEVEKQYNRPVEMYRMDVELIGANPNPQIITEEQQASFERYFLSWVNKDNSNQGVIANTYKKITYKNIYPHIDWIFYFNKKGQLEHDFVVHPGGKVSDIQIKYSGSTNLKLNDNGSLTAQSPMGTITENAPYSKEQSGREVASNFQFRDGVLSFAVADYSGTLIIDPILEWGTYFGGSDDETSYALTTDKWGNVYMTGSTSSLSNIATTGAHQTTFGGGTNSGIGADAFLSKWNRDGDLVWATYYGDVKVDVAKGVGCDTMGNVYMGGYTTSTIGISTSGSYQEVKAGNAARYDIFLVRFDTAGQRQWGTYYGGIQNEGNTAFGLNCDKQDNILITGNTSSNAGISTPGTYMPNQSDNYDGFLAKFNTSGQLQWGTYFGGSGNDYPQSVTSDFMGNIYITGYTNSLNGISTANAFQTINAGGDDAFLSKFDGSGQLIWSTYFGGASQDRGYVVSNHNNQIYVGGVAQSLTGIATSGSFKDTFTTGIGGDAFLANFNLNGNLNWSTYYGGENAESVGGIFINEQGDIYLSGQTQSLNGIATVGSIKDSISGSSDVYLVKFNTLGERQWGTYFGSPDIESFGFLTGDNNANIYLSGQTNGAVNIATNGSYQSTLNGGFDAFLVRLNDCKAPSLPSTIAGAMEVCAHSEQIYTVDIDIDAANYEWILPQGWIGNSDSNSINISISQNSGIIQIVSFSACGGVSDTQSLAVTVLSIPEPSIVNNNNILSTTQSYAIYQWYKNGLAITNATQSTYLVESNGNYSVKVTNNNDCENTSDSVEITDIVGIQELGENQNINIYPNPAKDLLNVTSNQTGVIEIWSIEGKMLLSKSKIHSGKNTISLKGINTGIYFLKFTNDKNQSKMLKIVKE